MKLCSSKFFQSLSKILDLGWEQFEKTSGIMENWGKWSEIDTEMLPEITSEEIWLENILSMRVLELFEIRVGRTMLGKKKMRRKWIQEFVG